MSKQKCCLCTRLSKAKYIAYLGTIICHECFKKLSKEELAEITKQIRRKFVVHRLNMLPYEERRVP